MLISRPLPRAFGVLASETNHAADAALLEALPHLAPDAQTAAIDLLVRREHTPTLVNLVSRARTLEEHVRQRLIARIGGLHSAARAAMSSPAFEGRASAIELIVASEAGGLAYLLSDALRSRCHQTRDLAAVSLHEMTRRVLDQFDAAAGPDFAVRADSLAEALRTAVLRWELHLQPKVIEAALWMIERVEPAIAEKLAKPHGKLVHALNEIIEGATDPRLAAAVLRALRFPELRAAASRAIMRANSAPFVHALIHESWILIDAEVEHGLRWVPEGRWLEDWAGGLPGVDDRHAARWVRVAAAIGGSANRKVERLRALVDAPRPAVRREALWRLVEDSSEPATGVLRLIASRTGDELSAVAARECRRRQGPTPARAASSSFPGRPDNAATTLQALRQQLASADPLDRARGLRDAQESRLSRELIKEVYRLANDPDRVVRACAVTALVDIPGPTTTRLLRAALHDPDDRVQANAIEALDRLDAHDHVDSIRPKLESSNSRVRANAVRALLRVEVREAGAALLDMLEDPAEAQRIGALWVVERLQLRSVIQRVAELSRKDPDARVRKRALRVLSELTARPMTGGQRPLADVPL